MKPYVYVTRKLPDQSLRKLQEVADVGMWKDDNTPVPLEVLEQEAKKAEGLLTMLSDKIDKSLLEKAEKLKVIANLAVGYDNIDLQVAKGKGIVVTNTPDVLTETTADLAFALLMATARRIVEADAYVREGKWINWGPLLLAGYDIHHKTIGIVGMGRIGEAVAKRAAGFGMKILYHNRKRKPETEDMLGAEYRTFDDLLKESDFVVCLTPLTSDTQRMFNAHAFEKMKETSIFINASRGLVVDEEALYQALLEKQIAAAGLDVFESEPISSDHPLLTLNNVVALPHIGSSSYETRFEMMDLAVDNILSILQGKVPVTPVRG